MWKGSEPLYTRPLVELLAIQVQNLLEDQEAVTHEETHTGRFGALHTRMHTQQRQRWGEAGDSPLPCVSVRLSRGRRQRWHAACHNKVTPTTHFPFPSGPTLPVQASRPLSGFTSAWFSTPVKLCILRRCKIQRNECKVGNESSSEETFPLTCGVIKSE